MNRDTSLADAASEKYRHLDRLLGDVEWLGPDSHWRAEIMLDLWLAVRAAAGQSENVPAAPG